MSLTYAQIISLATLAAKCPGYTSQAGMICNAVLAQLAQQHDFDIQKVTSFSVTLNGTTNNGAGPYNLPTDYLRHSENEINFSVNNVPFILFQIPIAQWRSLFLEGTGGAIPVNFATDFSTVQTLGFPQAYIYPAPNTAYVVQWPYFKAHAFVATPETSNAVPWFPDALYLYTKIAYELMKITDDERAREFKEDARDILQKYIDLKDDTEGYAFKIQMGQCFRGNFGSLPNAKSLNGGIGW